MTVKINLKPWQSLKARINRADALRVDVGVFEGTIARIAKFHEFGAPSAGIPERSFIRAALRERAGDLQRQQRRITTLLLKGKIDEQTAMKMLGRYAVGLMKNYINAQPKEWAPLAPATVKSKGSRKNKILINTGQLINSITSRILKR
jgi:phage gpG-like protein